MASTTQLVGLTVVLLGATACNPAPREAPRTNAPQTSEHAAEPRPAPPRAVACDESRIELLLSAPHDPPTAEQLTAACDDPVAPLGKLARDTSARGLLRLRAVESLGELGGEKAVQDLVRLATATADLASVRRSALVALAKSTAPGDAERERAGVSALSDADAHVRVAAVRLLQGSSSASIRSELERAKTRESEPFVRAEIERGLAVSP